MSVFGNPERVAPNPVDVNGPLSPGIAVGVAQCSIYTFPDTRSPESRGHLRSISHGGSTSLTSSTSAGLVVRPSALKGGRGHQRAFSQGQISENMSGVKQTPNRVGSKTDFILPPNHKEPEKNSTSSGSKHTRQPSRTESIYTLRRVSSPVTIWNRLKVSVLRRTPSDVDSKYRIIVPNHLVPPKTPKKEHPNGQAPDNRIRTTKYTLLSFLPRNLLEQFHRVANLYFIFIVLLNWFPAINSFGKEVAMIPVLFVLGVTAVKDLFEDRRRYTSDKRINNSTTRKYNSDVDRYKKVLWKDIRVGDIIHLANNEVVPADVLLLRTSDPNGLCYIDTGHLDGETNLKQRQVPLGFIEKLTSQQEVFTPSKFKSRIEVEAPTTKIYRFHGAMIHPNGERVNIGTDNLLLRECILKNTDFIEGIVVYAGCETKAMLNNKGPRYKRSTLECQMNQDVLWCVFILIALCVTAAICCKLYLGMFAKFGPPWASDIPEAAEAFLSFWSYIIILQIMIPLSLYVTIEMTKLIQVYHIHQNVDLYDPLFDQRTECRALNITEELGQIQYIFSDKTGTLTENRMIFRRCAIAGVDYEHPKLAEDGPTQKLLSLSILPNPRLLADLRGSSHGGTDPSKLMTTRKVHSFKLQEFFYLLALCNTVVCSTEHRDSLSSSGKQIDKEKLKPPSPAQNTTASNYARLDESSSSTPVSSPLLDKMSHITSVFTNSQAPPPGGETKQQDSSSASSGSQPNIPKPSFEAESPDELALVDAAYTYDFKLMRRTPNAAYILHNDLKQIQILKVLPFDSVRKRMSIIIRNSKRNEIYLYCKGADTSIFPLLAPQTNVVEQNIIYKTNTMLNEYAKEGLRVLAMAQRVIPEREFKQWNDTLQEISKELVDIDKKVQEHYAKIERDLVLVGATGIEDRLQEGVPETLHSLLSAGIVIWVLTGDKPETAINIAYSCKLFSPKMEMLTIMTRSKEAAESTILFYLQQIERDSSESPTTRNTSSRDKKKEGRALVIDGRTLTFILDRRTQLTTPFLKLTTKCNSVLCCRATPLQKAYLVKVVKEELKMRTLAIGDGANDVSMIQTADVGVGISGQEGMQAVMASDFALPRFKYLSTLLLVHGHWSYDRLARMVLYFFYKNACFVMLTYWYQMYCGFSATVFIDQMYLMLYNLIFTSLPPIALGVYDKKAPVEVLQNNPSLYKESRLGLTYSGSKFFWTMVDAIYQSLAIFYVCYFTNRASDLSIFELGATATTACMIVSVVHCAIESRSWTIIHVASIVVSIAAFYLYSFAFNAMCVNCLGIPSTHGIITHIIIRPTYWLIVVLAVAAALLPRFLYRVLQTTLYPDIVQRAMMSYKRSQHRSHGRGEGFLVSWSRSTSTSSIHRTDSRSKHNALTAVG